MSFLRLSAIKPYVTPELDFGELKKQADLEGLGRNHFCPGIISPARGANPAESASPRSGRTGFWAFREPVQDSIAEKRPNGDNSIEFSRRNFGLYLGASILFFNPIQPITV
jgi:hypothetical protein